MEVTPEILAKIPHANLGVPRDQFGAVWRAAELASQPGEHRAVGVAMTCRWLAGIPPPWARATRSWPTAPVVGRQVRAEPETIAEEVTAAVRELVHASSEERKQYLRGVVATFDWAWNGSKVSPLDSSGE